MPLITRLFGYQIYFWSNEIGELIHLHIAKGIRGFKNSKIDLGTFRNFFLYFLRKGLKL